MAKFELKLYDMNTEKVVKTLQRGFIPVSLYIKYQEVNEKLQASEVKSDTELFAMLCDLLLDTFPDLTREEYYSCVNSAEVMALYRKVCNKALISDEKN